MLAAFVLFESASPWSVVSAISNPFNLAAYALAVVLILVLKTRQKDKPIPPLAWGVVMLLVLIPTGFSLYQKIGKDTIYRVRVTVLNDQKLPIEDAKVWSSNSNSTLQPKSAGRSWTVAAEPSSARASQL